MHTRNVRSRTLRLLEDLVSKGEVRAEQALNRLGGVLGEDTELREFGRGRECGGAQSVSNRASKPPAALAGPHSKRHCPIILLHVTPLPARHLSCNTAADKGSPCSILSAYTQQHTWRVFSTPSSFI